MNLFRLIALSAITIGGRRVTAGARLALDAQSAAELIRAGRAMLADGADLGPLMDAVAPNRSRAAAPLQ